MSFDLDFKPAIGTVYLSGAIIGKTYKDARFGWRQYVAGKLDDNIAVLSPMRQEDHCAAIKGKITGTNIPENIFSRPGLMVSRDMLDIKRSDIVLINLLGTKVVSKGSMVELGVAYAWGKTIITCVTSDNCHWHPFVTEPSALIVQDLDEAIDAINGLLSVGI